MSGEHTGDVLEQRAEWRRGGVLERGARPSGGVERRGLVLGGDGRQHGRLPPPDGAAAELDAHGDVAHRDEAGGRDGEGRGERDVERARVGGRHVHGEGLLERVEAERLHGGGRGRGRRDGAEAGGGGGGLAAGAGGRHEGGLRGGKGRARAGGGCGEAERRRGERRVHDHWGSGDRKPGGEIRGEAAKEDERRGDQTPEWSSARVYRGT